MQEKHRFWGHGCIVQLGRRNLHLGSGMLQISLKGFRVMLDDRMDGSYVQSACKSCIHLQANLQL